MTSVRKKIMKKRKIIKIQKNYMSIVIKKQQKKQKKEQKVKMLIIKTKKQNLIYLNYQIKRRKNLLKLII